jgi:hypothetical protein
MNGYAGKLERAWFKVSYKRDQLSEFESYISTGAWNGNFAIVN